MLLLVAVLFFAGAVLAWVLPGPFREMTAIEGGTGEAPVRLTVPATAPYSYVGDVLSVEWIVQARDRSGSEREAAVWVNP